MDKIAQQQHKYAVDSGVTIERDDVYQVIDINFDTDSLREWRRDTWIEVSDQIMEECECDEDEADLIQAYRLYLS